MILKLDWGAHDGLLLLLFVDDLEFLYFVEGSYFEG